MVRRKAVVKGQPAARTFNVAKLADRLHYQACTTCRRRYACACGTPQENGRCNECRSGISSSWAAPLLPVSCCMTDCQLALNEDRLTYKLAGPGPWWLCRTCYRQHSYDPRSTAL